MNGRGDSDGFRTLIIVNPLTVDEMYGDWKLNEDQAKPSWPEA